VQEQIYGRQGKTSANFLNAPSRFYSRNTRWEFNVDKANQVLDAAGWKRAATASGEGRPTAQAGLPDLHQRPAPEDSADHQAAAAKAGIGPGAEVRRRLGFLFLRPANQDTYSHFYTDIQMYNTGWARRIRSTS